MRLILMLFLLSLMACGGPKQLTLQTPDVFPKDWAGTWQGELAVFRKGTTTQKMQMKLIILPQGDSIQWTIQYDTMDARPYTLKVLDKEKGIYLMDEHNSITIESYLFGNKFISQYDVAGNKLTVTEEKIGDKIIFEVLMSKDKPISTTGNSTHNGEEIPAVITYPVKIYQKAILSRIK